MIVLLITWEFLPLKYFNFWLICCTHRNLNPCWFRFALSLLPSYFNGRRGSIYHLPTSNPAKFVITFKRLHGICHNTLMPQHTNSFAYIWKFKVSSFMNADGAWAYRKECVIGPNDRWARALVVKIGTPATTTYTARWLVHLYVGDGTMQNHRSENQFFCYCGKFFPDESFVPFFEELIFTKPTAQQLAVTAAVWLPAGMKKNGQANSSNNNENDCFTFWRLRDESTFTTSRHTDSSYWQVPGERVILLLFFSPVFSLWQSHLADLKKETG